MDNGRAHDITTQIIVAMINTNGIFQTKERHDYSQVSKDVSVQVADAYRVIYNAIANTESKEKPPSTD
ncbi:MAG: hypothetical protein ACYCOU_20830 [Sulfobacillus sp.]